MDYLIPVLVGVWLIAAAFTDLKKREVPDWLNFSLLAILLGIKGVESILSMNVLPLVYAIAWAGIFFVIAIALYYGRIFAGGDAKLLIALGPAFSSFTSASNFFLNSLIVASFYGVAWSIGLAIANRKKFKKNIFDISKKTFAMRIIGIIAAFVLLILSALTKFAELSVLGVVMLSFPYIYTFVKTVEVSCLIKKVSPEKLTEGDWLVSNVRLGKKIIKAKFSGLNSQEINFLRKGKKSVLIKEGIPFVPVFLISFLATIIFGNFFFWIIQGIL